MCRAFFHLSVFRSLQVTGHAEQWGSVTHKKEKKATTTPAAQGKEVAGGRDRGEARGARGGRVAGRGGRGGATGRGGLSRGAHRETNGRHAPSPAPVEVASASGAWGASSSSKAQDTTTAPAHAASTDAASAETSAEGSSSASGAAAKVENDWTQDSHAVDSFSAQNEKASTSTPGWGDGAGGAWGSTNGNGSAIQNPVAPVPTLAAKAVKTPLTSNLSWAQIAKSVSTRLLFF